MRSTASLPSLLCLAATVALNPFATQPAAAQERVTLDEVRRELSVGDPVSIVRTDGGTISGRLARFGDTDLIIVIVSPVTGVASRRLEVTIPLSTLQSLERPRDSTKNGALIGAGIGGGAAVALFVYALAVDRNELDEWGPSYLAGGAALTGIGALAGWAIDRAHSKRHIRFDISGARSGLRLTVSR